jgi:hypothetical protein
MNLNGNLGIFNQKINPNYSVNITNAIQTQNRFIKNSCFAVFTRAYELYKYIDISRFTPYIYIPRVSTWVIAINFQKAYITYR